MKRTAFMMALLSATVLVVSANAQQAALQGRVSNIIEEPKSRVEISEQKLNNTYQHLAALLDKGGRKKLAVAQQTWREYSKAECDFTTRYAPAEPLHPLTYPECLMVMNTERTADLQYQLEWLRLLDPMLEISKEAG